jgi:D-alanine transaminase
VNIEDRGYQFGDGIYEVVHLYRGRFIDEDRHLGPAGALAEGDPAPHADAADARLSHVLKEVAAAEPRDGGLLYMQVTRGVAHRDHPFPKEPVPPAPGGDGEAHQALSRTSVATGAATPSPMPDLRWAHRDIKSINLLPNVLARQAATEQGAAEAILYEEGDRRGDRGRRDQLLDRRRRGRHPHPRAVPRHPAGLHPWRADGRAGGGRHRLRLERVHLEEMKRRTGGLHHLRHLLREADPEDRRRTWAMAPRPGHDRLFEIFARHVKGGAKNAA